MLYQNTNSKDALRYNILFLMNGAKPPRGGEFLTLYLITHLRKDLFHPLLAYAYEGLIVQQLKKADIDNIQIPLSSNIANVYPREINLHSPFFVVSFLWHLVLSGSIFKLNKILKENNIHLIYCADNISKFIGGIAGKMAGVQVVAHCHDDFKEDTLGKTMRMFYLMLLDRILTVSDKVKKFFAVNKKGFRKAITVYNGIDTDVFNPQNVSEDLRNEMGFKKGNIFIGVIGVLEKDKGHRYLIEALAKLKAEGIANVICLICGTGAEKSALEEFVHASGLDREVLFLGFRTDVPRVLKTLDILVLTSLTIESFSMAAVEAMAMKVPVIATNVGGIPEVVDDGKTGIIVPPANVNALCEAIKYLIKNPEARLKMGENGRARVLEKFTIEQNVRKTEEIFLEVVQGSIRR
jgi:glycosyltransferase involved in cell wall biosynthesis